MALQNNWRLGDHPELGMMNQLNAIIRAADAAIPFALPNFSSALAITVGSDYSGQHQLPKQVRASRGCYELRAVKEVWRA
jgi:hypothetical protein